MKTIYEEGYAMGAFRAMADDYDPRWDFAHHAKMGTLAEFKRGFEDGFDAKRATIEKGDE